MFGRSAFSKPRPRLRSTVVTSNGKPARARVLELSVHLGRGQKRWASDSRWKPLNRAHVEVGRTFVGWAVREDRSGIARTSIDRMAPCIGNEQVQIGCNIS